MVEMMGSELELVKGDVLDSENSIDKNSGVRLSKTNMSSFRLTLRDLEILGFLLDQKFASLEQLYFRYFDVRKSASEPLPKGLFVTRQRLQILRRAGLVATAKVYSEAKSLYLLTTPGYQTFQSKKPQDAFAKPMLTVDFRNYEHDTKVNDCRIALERSGRVMKWIAERRVRIQGFESQYSFAKLPKEIVPDGIFISSKGERVAFEIEASHREKRRFVAKREAYESIMGGNSPLIHRVIWTGATEPIQAQLREVASKNQKFILESYSHFLSKLWPRGVPERIKS